MMQVVCKDQKITYNAYHLVKAFYPGETVTLTVQEDLACRIFVTGEEICGGKLCAEDIPALYEVLKKMTGTELPWGMLTGVRPVKLATAWIGAHFTGGKETGEEMKAAENAFAAWFYHERRVSKEKAQMAFRIALREQQLLREIHAKSSPSKDESFGLVSWISGYSLYIGIPFCPSICSYCSFSSGSIRRYQDKIPDYLKALMREMQQKKAQQKAEYPTTIYIGGGTPTSLSEQDLKWLLEQVDRIFQVPEGISCGAIREYTVEAGRPDSITEEKLAILKSHGVTRISINPQTMQQKTLDRIGRKHTVEQVRETFQMARRMGFDNINMDLIMGLPGEENTDVQDTLRQIRLLHPDSLTVHSLAIKRSSGMGIAKKLQKTEQETGDPGSADIRQMIEDAGALAGALDMAPYYLYRQKSIAGNFENIGYAVSGKEGIYNILIMEEVQTILACGAGASSKIVYGEGVPDPARKGQITYMIRKENPKDIDTYIAQY